MTHRQTLSKLSLAAGLVLAVALLASGGPFRPVAVNTLLLSSSVALASCLLGAPLAFLLVRTDARLRGICQALLASLLFLPLYLQAAAWQAALGTRGWLTAAFAWPAIVDGWPGAILIHTAAAIPWVVLIVGIGLRLIEPELEELAQLDARGWTVFWRVTLRRAAPAIGAALLWVFVATAGEMTVTDLFGIRTSAEQIYVELALGDNPGTTVWNYLPNVAFTLAVLCIAEWLAIRLSPQGRFAPRRRGVVFRLGRWRTWGTSAALGSVLLLAGIPLVSLVVQAGMIVEKSGSQLARSWSWAKCLSIVAASPARHAREFGWSLLIAVLAASTALVIGVVLTWAARHSAAWRMAAWLAIALALSVPGPLVGLAIIQLFNGTQIPLLNWLYDHSIAPVWLAQVVRALPAGALVTWYALANVPNELLDSAALDGANPAVQLWKVAVPMRLRGLGMAWLVALAISWGELAASILVVPPGVSTLPITLFGLIHFGVDDRVAGMSLCLVGLVFLLGTGVSLLARRLRA